MRKAATERLGPGAAGTVRANYAGHAQALLERLECGWQWLVT